MLARLRDPDLIARVTIHGTDSWPLLTLENRESGEAINIPEMPRTSHEWEGEAYLSGTNYLLRMQVVDGGDGVIEEFHLGTALEERVLNSAWVDVSDGEPLNEHRLFELLAGLDRLEPVEDSARGSDPVRLQAPSGTTITPRTLFLADSPPTAPTTGALEIEALADGTPVRVSVAGRTELGDEPAPSGDGPALTFEFDFDYELVDRVALPDRTPAMAPMSTRFGISLDRPIELEVSRDRERFDEASDGETYLRVVGTPVFDEWAGSSDDELLELWSGAVVDDLGVGDPQSVEPAIVAGRPAYILTFSEGPGQDPLFFQAATFINNGTMHGVSWQVFGHDTELTARYAFEHVLDTVEFDPD